MTGDNVLCKSWYLLWEKQFQTTLRYLLGDVIGIKIFEEHPRPSYICVLLPRGPRRRLHFAKRQRSTNCNYLNKRSGVY